MARAPAKCSAPSSPMLFPGPSTQSVSQQTLHTLHGTLCARIAVLRTAHYPPLCWLLKHTHSALFSVQSTVLHFRICTHPLSDTTTDSQAHLPSRFSFRSVVLVINASATRRAPSVPIFWPAHSTQHQPTSCTGQYAAHARPRSASVSPSICARNSSSFIFDIVPAERRIVRRQRTVGVLAARGTAG